MFPDVGITPDPARIVHRHVGRLLAESDQDMLHLYYLPDGYNTHKHGTAIVVSEDVGQVDGAGHTRDGVKVSVYSPVYEEARRLGRNLYTALTQGVTGIGLGVSRQRSVFYGAGPSYTPTGFVSTMTISVGLSRFFVAPAKGE